MKKYEELENVINEIDEKNMTLADKLVRTLKDELHLNIGFCDCCYHFRINSQWIETKHDEYLCDHCVSELTPDIDAFIKEEYKR